MYLLSVRKGTEASSNSSPEPGSVGVHHPLVNRTVSAPPPTVNSYVMCETYLKSDIDPASTVSRPWSKLPVKETMCGPHVILSTGLLGEVCLHIHIYIYTDMYIHIHMYTSIDTHVYIYIWKEF